MIDLIFLIIETMGSCSICSKSNPRQTIKSIQTHPKVTHMTPLTGDKYAGFESLRTEKSNILFSSQFAAYGMSAFQSEDPFCEKSVCYKGKDSSSYFSNNRISVTCRKGLKDSENQDNFCVMSKPPVFCAGVFTGNGENGHIISALFQKTLPEVLIALESSKFGLKSKVFQSFHKSTEKVVEKCEKAKIQWKESLASATFAVVCAQVLVVGCVGLGRAFVFRRNGSEFLSVPLKNEIWNHFEGKDELEKGKKGFEEIFKGSQKEFCLEIQSGLILNNDEFLVICSNTVLEVINPEEIGETLEKYESDSACNYLANLAWSRWIEKNFERFDDITVLILPIK